ncbi:hypothetical protein ElyMa_000862000 [Elysia marginata]|uniref:Uncharacterized protein n=1 Tax=Elysia marginata TaxID=1093978 RepID=A0AAV4H3X6_9GAST|nr:hypothetical protein ElyMa_000862000 [Elysia marginata]
MGGPDGTALLVCGANTTATINTSLTKPSTSPPRRSACRPSCAISTCRYTETARLTVGHSGCNNLRDAETNLCVPLYTLLSLEHPL